MLEEDGLIVCVACLGRAFEEARLQARDFQTGEMIYTHVLNRGGRGVDSPVDRL